MAALPLRAQTDGAFQWRFLVGGYVTFSAPASNADGTTIYVGAETSTGGRVMAVSRDGASRWGPRGREVPGAIESSPAVSADGQVVYIATVSGRLYALNAATGASFWELQLGSLITGSPALGSDGTIYIGADNRLYAVTPAGSARAIFLSGGIIDSSVAIAGDGTLYVTSYDGALYALTPDGQEKWRFVSGFRIRSSPAIGLDGTVYFGSGDQRVYAIAPDGAKRWDFFTNGPVDASPVVAADGTVYVASDRTFYAFRPDTGAVRWRTDIATGSISTAAVRSDGVIIFGADDGVIRALNPNGTERWRYETQAGPDKLIESSPLIAPDGSIYIGSFDGGLYKLAGNGTSLSTFSTWPAFRRDARHSGRVPALNNTGRLANISTRAVAGGANNLVAGFVLRGSAPRTHLIRAVGPGLAKVGFTGFMPDPKLQLFSGSQPLQANDNWTEKDEVSLFPVAETAAAVGAFPLDPGSRDAAIVRLLPPGVFTAQVTESTAGTGVALVEVYDVRESGDPTARLINLSTRGHVGIGQNILIAGFVVRDGPMRLLLRGIGPSLAQFGVPATLDRPILQLFRDTTVIASNTGWSTEPTRGDLAGAAATVSAFPLADGSADSVLLRTLDAGAYTLQIAGVAGATGEAMVEIYVLP